MLIFNNRSAYLIIKGGLIKEMLPFKFLLNRNVTFWCMALKLTENHWRLWFT